MNVPALIRLLIDRAMDLAVAAPEPRERILLALALQHLLHLRVSHALRVDEVVEHAGRVDEGQHGRDGGGLARQERVPAAHVDEDGGQDGDEQDDHGDDDAAPEGAEGLVALVRLWRAGRPVVFEEALAVHGEGRHGHSEEVEQDRAEADEGEEPVAVEERFEREPAVGRALIVEGEAALGVAVAFGEEVERLDHAAVGLEGRPDHFDDGCDEDGEPGCVDGHVVGRCEVDYGNEDQADDEGADERVAGGHSKHERVRVFDFPVVRGHLLRLFHVFALPDGGLVEDETPMAETFMNLSVSGKIEALEVIQDVRFDCHGCDTGDASRVVQES